MIFLSLFTLEIWQEFICIFERTIFFYNANIFIKNIAEYVHNKFIKIKFVNININRKIIKQRYYLLAIYIFFHNIF